MLILLRGRLEKLRDAPVLPTVICIAAIAGLLVVEKYSKLSELSEVYRIAMGMHFMFAKYPFSSCTAVMCPDKKLTWFDGEDVTAAEQFVRQRWSETYEGFSDVELSSHPSGSPVKVCCIYFSARVILNGSQAHSNWLFSGRHETWRLPEHAHDSIDAYLTEPLVPTHEINNAGGVLQYWERHLATRPHLARMALDFLTAPGGSQFPT